MHKVLQDLSGYPPSSKKARTEGDATGASSAGQVKKEDVPDAGAEIPCEYLFNCTRLNVIFRQFGFLLKYSVKSHNTLMHNHGSDVTESFSFPDPLVLRSQSTSSRLFDSSSLLHDPSSSSSSESGSDTEDREGTNLDGCWRGDADSDAESVDSDMEDPLK